MGTPFTTSVLWSRRHARRQNQHIRNISSREFCLTERPWVDTGDALFPKALQKIIPLTHSYPGQLAGDASDLLHDQ